jgi:hypothetical protein
MGRKLIYFILVSIILFTVTAIWVQVQTNMELSSTLITCFYAFFGTELLALASIKKAELKFKDIDNDGIPDDEDDYVDPSYIQELEETLEKLKNRENEGE